MAARLAAALPGEIVMDAANKLVLTWK